MFNTSYIIMPLKSVYEEDKYVYLKDYNNVYSDCSYKHYRYSNLIEKSENKSHIEITINKSNYIIVSILNRVIALKLRPDFSLEKSKKHLYQQVSCNCVKQRFKW